MYDLGDYPAVIRDGVTAISGEVYAVNARVLAALDRLEEYPRVYDRVMIETPYGRSWMYVMHGAPGYPLVYSGQWQQR